MAEVDSPRNWSRVIYSEDGDKYLLAADEATALAYAKSDGLELGDAAGWMVETGWDMDNYESKEQFEAESGFTTYWMGCQPPNDGQVREGLLRAWEVGCA